MTFEAGPWHCFGNELLDRLIQIIEIQNNQQPGAVQPPPPQKAINTRSSHGALTLLPTGTGSISMPSGTTSGQLFDFDQMKKITFVPDYSAVIRDDCTYLEITAQTYLLAYKSTLININKNK